MSVRLGKVGSNVAEVISMSTGPESARRDVAKMGAEIACKALLEPPRSGVSRCSVELRARAQPSATRRNNHAFSGTLDSPLLPAGQAVTTKSMERKMRRVAPG